MKGYTTFGYTQLKDSDFEGWTESKLRKRFEYLPSRVVDLIVTKYAKKPKAKKD